MAALAIIGVIALIVSAIVLVAFWPIWVALVCYMLDSVGVTPDGLKIFALVVVAVVVTAFVGSCIRGG